jgi:hypothetical protein
MAGALYPALVLLVKALDVHGPIAAPQQGVILPICDGHYIKHVELRRQGDPFPQRRSSPRRHGHPYHAAGYAGGDGAQFISGDFYPPFFCPVMLGKISLDRDGVLGVKNVKNNSK